MSRPSEGGTHKACSLQCGTAVECLPRELTPLGQGKGGAEVQPSTEKGRTFGKSIPRFQERPWAGAWVKEDLACPQGPPPRLPLSHLRRGESRLPRDESCGLRNHRAPEREAGGDLGKPPAQALLSPRPVPPLIAHRPLAGSSESYTAPQTLWKWSPTSAPSCPPGLLCLFALPLPQESGERPTFHVLQEARWDQDLGGTEPNPEILKPASPLAV